MKFIETLSMAPRLVLDRASLRLGMAALVATYPELTALVLQPGPTPEEHVIDQHSRPGPDRPAAGSRILLPPALVDTHLGDAGYALMHAPYPEDTALETLLPGAESLFLRRAWTAADEPLLLLFGMEGVNAEFASRQVPNLLAERLRHRFDESLLQTRVQLATRRLERQIEEVKTVKEKLLPAADHRVEGLRYAVHYRPCSGAGGDYFEVSDLRAARERILGTTEGTVWGMIIADVSGHGPGAAVEVAMIDSILRTYAGQPEHHPGMVLSYCNRHMFTRQIRGGFATMFLCNYDGATGTLEYACAGHPPPLVKCAGEQRVCRVLDEATDIPLGIVTDHQWHSAAMELGAGDMLVLYTDGATEAESPAGRQFGVEGIRAAAARSTAAEPDGLLADIVNALNAHAGSLDVGDDCTIMVAQPE